MAYVNRLTDIENELAAVGKLQTENEKRRSLLRGLTKKFKLPVQVIRALEKGRSEAIELLVTYEINSPDSVDEISLTRSSAMISSRPYAKKCHHCGRLGHYKSDCFHSPESASYGPDKRNAVSNRRSRTNKHQNGKGYSQSSHRRVNGNQRPSGTGYFTFIANSAKPTNTFHPSKPTEWFIDSGSSAHMCNDPPMLDDIQFNLSGPFVSVGNGSKATVKGMDTLCCTALVQGCDGNIILTNTLLIPDLMCNLVSVSKIRKSGFDVKFETNKEGKSACSVLNSEDTKVDLQGIECSDGLCNVDLSTAEKSMVATACAARSIPDSLIWHCRLGHVSQNILRKTETLVTGVLLIKFQGKQDCNTFLKSNSTLEVRSLSIHNTNKNPLELMHADIEGMMRHLSTEGA